MISEAQTKAVAVPSEPHELTAEMVTLIEKGKEQGFVTYDDILDVFPEAEDELDMIDALYQRLMSDGVSVLADNATAQDEGQQFVAKQDEEDRIRALRMPAATGLTEEEMKSGALDDPVRMYLREIGRVNLLTAQEEV